MDGRLADRQEEAGSPQPRTARAKTAGDPLVAGNPAIQGEPPRGRRGSDRRTPEHRAAPEVRSAWPPEAPQLAALLARAFYDDPFHAWLLPRRRAPTSRRLFRLLLVQAFQTGCVSTTSRLAGAAVWRPPQEQRPPRPEPWGLTLGFLWLLRRRLSRLPEVYRRIESFHPEEPHWHLSVLGTAPECQREGVGSALLAATLTRCDQERRTAYLECSQESNVAFYEKQGFRVVGTVEVRDGPTLWPMRREPGA